MMDVAVGSTIGALVWLAHFYLADTINAAALGSRWLGTLVTVPSLLFLVTVHPEVRPPSFSPPIDRMSPVAEQHGARAARRRVPLLRRRRRVPLCRCRHGPRRGLVPRRLPHTLVRLRVALDDRSRAVGCRSCDKARDGSVSPLALLLLSAPPCESRPLTRRDPALCRSRQASLPSSCGASSPSRRATSSSRRCSASSRP